MLCPLFPICLQQFSCSLLYCPGSRTLCHKINQLEPYSDEIRPLLDELFEGRLPASSNILTPLHIDDSVSSLSAILLNDEYYQALLHGRDIIDGFSVLKHSWLIPFKAKAWLDLNARSLRGEHVDSRNLKKHRNDIIRMAAELVLERCELPGEVREDMAKFIDAMNVSDQEIKNLKIRGVRAEDIRQLLINTYL